MRAFVGAGKREIGLRCRAGLLDEPVQHDHPPVSIDIEQDSDGTIAGKARADFVKPVAHRPARRHANRPAELDRLQVLADASPVLRIHCPQPFADGLVAARRSEENGGYPLHRSPAAPARELLPQSVYYVRYIKSRTYLAAQTLDAAIAMVQADKAA